MSSRKPRRSVVFLLTLAVIAICPVAWADEADRQPRTGFIDRVFSDETGDHRYVLFVPHSYSPDKKWPVIVFLHGAGERGSDGRLQLTAGLGPFVRKHEKNFPFLALFPQCEEGQARILDGWSAQAEASHRMLKILDSVEADYSVNPAHRILSGWSMGGYGVWSIAAATPDRWSALISVSGGGDAALAKSLKEIPAWAIHGARDNIVRPSAVQGLISELQEQGATPWLTIVPNAEHDVWKSVFASEDVYRWMLSPTNEGTPPNLTPSAEGEETDAPFLPVLEIANAAELRLGNRLLNGLSYAIPSYVPDSALKGAIADIQDTTNADGYFFNVQMSRIGYDAKLAQARVTAIGRNRLQLKLALEKVNVTIGQISIWGDGRSAVAGPSSISIGHARPAWLTIEVEPYVENRRIRLKTVRSGFQIDPDNYLVTPPWGVSVRGLGMDRRRVSNSIVQGLYGRRQQIESEVSAAVPSILKWVEETLDIGDAGMGVSAIWPLPVYRPAIRIWPEAVQTDNQGVTLRLGLAAAAPTSQPLQFRSVELSDSAERIGPETTLQLNVHTGVMEPLSQLLVESQVASINVLDIPGDAFAPLARNTALASAIPGFRDMPEQTVIRTEFQLRKPFLLKTSPALRTATRTQQHEETGDDQPATQPAPSTDSLTL
ncbi:MAG: hypothetical protein KDA96_23235, partial [Planctomycetaceae bacterium]|nr:hypothetical protein [Planctomycetaceae bacterium]